MSLPKFIVGMIFALAIVVGWSYFDDASLGTIIMRAVICAVVIQVGYFLLIYAMIARSSPTSAAKTHEVDRGIKVAEGERLTARRGSLR
ncbi:exopolysaccharide production repressor exox [Mesorhizobium sp. M1C.F.Ca.ET.193.01.1.1]|uniref:exopolysaccharide production repressor protein n=1 Tax=unclassified Mesorhizobium TaxID=325217 RepID=UPI000FD56DE2|nr:MULTISPECIES: exopolysaccharide production repressor protein [unclassified Mesorhizobium]TGT04385.1 exopolysaccharide production repressor exox [bacterium M00.F.Ca.ET.177.01.1.1]RWA77626.1 MAG: exopolysaccharide production repressor exox [Mesorhizobium sp.]RWC05899.1 MAG: exopolysaccharide production repressor exox [Mesorhizobium sp.]RWG87937.1 MAG: exopolysaccharide production repressor exox [Mesorhizobium sp.]RWG91444.1 MAG: exopolysaccharide production repressor exox [Mesorhizobium sp.]